MNNDIKNIEDIMQFVTRMDATLRVENPKLDAEIEIPAHLFASIATALVWLYEEYKRNNKPFHPDWASYKDITR